VPCPLGQACQAPGCGVAGLQAQGRRHARAERHLASLELGLVKGKAVMQVGGAWQLAASFTRPCLEHIVLMLIRQLHYDK
jgi:hypothetical protein